MVTRVKRLLILHELVRCGEYQLVLPPPIERFARFRFIRSSVEEIMNMGIRKTEEKIHGTGIVL